MTAVVSMTAGRHRRAPIPVRAADAIIDSPAEAGESSVSMSPEDALLGEAGVGALIEAFQGGEPFVVHGDRGRLPAWLNHSSLQSVEALCADYQGRILYGRRDGGPKSVLIEHGSAGDLLAAGEALYLPDLSEVISESDSWLRNFESIVGIPAGTARATAWVAPAGEGTALHLDAEDVLSIQLVGCKCFEVAEPAALPYASGYQFGPGIPAAAALYPQAVDGFPDAEHAHFTPVELEPGSVLVLPRGHWHRTRCHTVSLSVSIVCAPPLFLDWALGVLRHRALQDSRWRRPLYGAPTPAQRAALAQAWAPLLAGLADASGDATWTEATTLQWSPTRRFEAGDPPRLRDLYEGTDQALALEPAVLSLLSRLAHHPAAFTVAEARDQWQLQAIEHLQALVEIGALYRWPVAIVRN